MVELPAGLPTLADFDQRGAQPPAVADAHGLLGHAAGGDVLSEGARGLQQRMVTDRVAPEAVVVVGIVMDRLVGSAVHRKVGLLVSGKAEPVHPNRTCHRLLADRAGLAGRAEGADLAALDREDGNRKRHCRLDIRRYRDPSSTGGTQSSVNRTKGSIQPLFRTLFLRQDRTRIDMNASTRQSVRGAGQ
jgi:hypothetical protein